MGGLRAERSADRSRALARARLLGSNELLVIDSVMTTNDLTRSVKEADLFQALEVDPMKTPFRYSPDRVLLTPEPAFVTFAN